MARLLLEDPLSAEVKVKRVTTRDIRARKGGDPVVVLTAYTAPIARLLDPHVDVLLVGDSVGMVLYGMDTTLGVTVDMMINHGQAVMRGSARACVVVDMPFGSYQESKEQAFRNAARIMSETGCAAVKLEGGREMAETIRFLTERCIPVMAHIGLKPQAVHAAGGFRAQGRIEAEAEQIRDDARAITEAGAFCVVVEGTVEPVARALSAEIGIPTIGIGASPACDGQVLVTEDVLGLFSDFTPKFVKRYADLSTPISEAAARYAAEVKSRAFPGPEHCFGLPKTPKA
ncbi:3-methyl-2-oxobutanoate hydroxymethyltransferase [Magnetospirillum gryphiswaldense]|uniref:3-methyl-2-oxobutanoate hydroxymethyltransferase n=1 Tax=Magnetospirillum gryphiswaldense TaxID=55518 RepID=A4U3B1_9PROT|nr:3-methyl-2-oxobutanoate hydroxymethyltransferase [Magnetospirillum gryphiswaldense]AVM75887.1 3-methyl-2-oxobutanoate hydroxymethyltransferase [Magnetospirillum gryphiswaldense MSR-1]AVM79790.1 3-methyl-2-oxobutanoate hydroxymethyltransferase [Magnetospirillum gryphiswaldense]CAM77368.1 3-methyl-2-oxobutanoate hydroxymethyltransferase [Magnetospirillum gryphiswaldense MSR-1]